MNREIKFRAWLKESKKMVNYVSHLKHAPDCGIFEITVPFDESGLKTFRKLYSVDEFDLMQYTGLKDKNGKEIYEGDIIKIGEIEIIVIEDIRSLTKLFQAIDKRIYLEVIGNIYQLLK